MELVTIRGIATEDKTFETVRSSRKLGKGIADPGLPAFIVNRILLPMINKRSTLYEGVGSVRRSIPP